MSRVTDALDKARREAGLSRKQLAQMIGISAQFMTDIGLGRRNLPSKYFGNLPAEIRGPVIDAAQAELMEEADKLEAMR